MEDFELLNAATGLGFDILSHGAETYRVEESIRRICAAYGKGDADVFVIPSSIVVTIPCAQGRFMTKSRRVLTRDTDLDKVDQLNDLSRRICRETPDYAEVMEALDAIRTRSVWSFPVMVLATASISCFFTLFYGGNFRDGLAAFFIGILLKLLIRKMEQLRSTAFFINIVGGGMVALLAKISVLAGLAMNMDKMIIGTLMNLVPGISLTNAMRDFIAGDLIAGIIKLVEALIVATGIAIGAMVTLAYLGPIVEVLL